MESYLPQALCSSASRELLASSGGIGMELDGVA